MILVRPSAGPSHRARIHEQLKREILEGRLAPGSRLRQQDVARRYGVSIIPVREAFSELQGEGLLALRPHQGALIAPLRAADIEDIFDVRAVVEPLAVQLSVPLLESRDVAKMTKILGSLGDRLQKDLRWAALNQEFHAIVVSKTKRPVLSRILTMLRDAVRFHGVHLSATQGLDEGQREHELILRACAKRDGAEAARYTRRHILETKRRLLEALRQHEVERGAIESGEATWPETGRLAKKRRTGER